MELFLAAATILGGLAALWFFAEKAKAIPWERVRFPRRRGVSERQLAPQQSGVASVSFSRELEQAVGEAFPSYRLPTAGDLHDDWAHHYDPQTMFPLACSGNFRATGRPDFAVFLLSNDRPSYKVIVALQDNGVLRLVDLTSGGGMPQNLFVRTVPAGTYRPEESTRLAGVPIVRRLKLVGDGINFGTFESADCIYYWVPATGRFERVWMSD